MRKYFVFIGLFAAVVLLPSVAAAKQIAVSLTKDQVATVCNGASYCEKSCGLNGQNTCTFGCGSKGCSGMCSNCASRTTATGAIHGIVGGTLSNATAIRSSGPSPTQTPTSGATNLTTTKSSLTQPSLLGSGGTGAGGAGTTRQKQIQGVAH